MNIWVLIFFLLAGVLFLLTTIGVSHERVNIIAGGLLALTIALVLALGIVP